ncbi:PAC2 family protein [Nakamurella lactea]|uniref:PAC2 family protein n=1 Tax=Nakamurella lactea TaxID=459515 RepID=UPI0004280E85|nr:PAC2 family protein [Nakamurella lactea]
MLEPGDLYTLNAQAADGLGEPVLLVALDGYVDAGNGVRIAVQHLLQGTEALTDEGGPDSPDAGNVVVRFDADVLTDYRSRRPTLTYTDGAFTAYEGLDLQIRRLTDTAGTPYLLLTGPEPDLLWERFTAAIVDLVHRLNIRLVIGLMAIPMAVPHTRPAGMSKHSGQPGLVSTSEAFMGTMQVPGHVAGLIEYRLGELGLNAIGLAAHVPHYLSRSDYPVTAQHLLRTVGELAALQLDPEGLNAAIGTFDSELAGELEGNAEVAEVVQALERQYDTFVAATGRGLLAESEPLPTADELGAQIEAFLADQDPHTN